MTILPIIGLLICVVYFNKKCKLDDILYNKIIKELVDRKHK